MSNYESHAGDFSLKAYPGDFKTLLAFNFVSEGAAKNLAGFTIKYAIPNGGSFYLWNSLVFEHPNLHAQDAGEPARSTLNAPIHKFRWVHVPGVIHQNEKPAVGTYRYEVTPRFFDANQRMVAIDSSKTASLAVPVGPFKKGNLRIAFTRGFVQSEAFVNRFGKQALLKPKAKTLIFNTQDVAGQRPTDGTPFTFEEEYAWLGFTARTLIFDLLAEVEGDLSLKLDVFCYDLTEPNLIEALVRLAAIPDKLRVILDNASLHHDSTFSKPEDQAEALIKKAGEGRKVIKRGRFSRYAHDKVLLVSDKNGPKRVLTGSTNFSVNGIYVNSNHVLIYDDQEVAGWYKGVFDTAWDTDVKTSPFIASNWSTETFTSSSNALPKSVFHFSPHDKPTAAQVLGGIVDRVKEETKIADGKASILFAVMSLNQKKDTVYECLNAIHATSGIFSYGISDAPGGVTLYPIGENHGVLVTGKPGTTELPAPFDQVPPIQEHQVHHKFVVCGFNRPDAIVYCGSSNLAEGGENENGDNLIAISDPDVATAFAIEALALVDHFAFLDHYSKNAIAQGDDTPMPAAKVDAAKAIHWYLSTTDAWVGKYFKKSDLHCVDRELFGSR